MEKIKNWWSGLSKRNKIIVICAVLVIGGIASLVDTDINEVKTGYTRIYQNICDETNKKCTEYKIADPILVKDNDEGNYSVYDTRGYSIGTIAKSDVVFEGTPEYENAKKERESADNTAAQYKAEQNSKIIKELEPKMKDAFYKIELNTTNDLKRKNYFYINPVIWNNLDFDKKQKLFYLCVDYARAKTNPAKPEYATVQTIIANSKTMETLAKYSTKGVEIK